MNGPNNIYSLDISYKDLVSNRPKNKWLELSFSYRRDILTTFTPVLKDPKTGCIDRELYKFELARYLGLDPLTDVLSKPHLLVIGDNTDLGSELVRTLQQKQNLTVAHTGCQHSIDFASSDSSVFFDIVNISRAFITCSPHLPMFSKTDGAKDTTFYFNTFLKGIFRNLKKHGIPSIWATSPRIYAEHEATALAAGSHIVLLPNLLHPLNEIGRAARDCLASGHTTVEGYPGELLSDISAEETADFLISKLEPLNKGSLREFIELRPSNSLKMEDVVQRLGHHLKCNASYVIHPHKPSISRSPRVLEIHSSNHPNAIPIFIRSDLSLKPKKNEIKTLEEIQNEKASKNIINNINSVNTKNQKKSENTDQNDIELSIVAVGRHDNFASGFEARTEEFLKAIARDSERFPSVNFELVFVDWATPQNEKLLHETLNIPSGLKNRLRFVNVPPSVHAGLQKKLNTSLVFFEYIAKNVGIRRAKGKFILTTNSDILLPSTIFELFSRHEFHPGVIYRALRWDSRDNNTQTSEINKNSESHENSEKSPENDKNDKTGKNDKNDKNDQNDKNGKEKNETPKIQGTPEELWQAAGEPWRLRAYNVKKRCTDGENRFSVSRNVEEFQKAADPCGAGDFLMMSKDMWMTIGGFPEVAANPNVDAVFIGKLMKLIPGSVRFFIHPPIVHQRHPNVNKARNWLQNHEEIMKEYACSGESKKLGKNGQVLRWGLSDQTFTEVLL